MVSLKGSLGAQRASGKAKQRGKKRSGRKRTTSFEKELTSGESRRTCAGSYSQLSTHRHGPMAYWFCFMEQRHVQLACIRALVPLLFLVDMKDERRFLRIFELSMALLNCCSRFSSYITYLLPQFALGHSMALLLLFLWHWLG